jgi:SAM-dependent methyltransferase
MSDARTEEIRRAVRDRYAAIARGERTGCDQESRAGETVPCCSPGEAVAWPTSLRAGYTEEDYAALPEGAELGLGCGNPAALASLSPGEVVLDLGSGAGVDCFLAANRVGKTGRVIGVDMTPDMIERARENARRVGADRVEFRLGEIEHLPVADGTIDVILSNCVVNLAPDKSSVFGEAFRVLKPGGRLAISDLVAKTEIPEAVRNDLAMHSGCIAGAITAAENERLLREAGFVDVRVTVRGDAAPKTEGGCGCGGSEAPGAEDEPGDWVASASIEARRPA